MKKRILWWTASLLLALAVLWVMPGSVIRMNMMQLRRLIGGYSGTGHWKIDVHYLGTAVSTYKTTGEVDYTQHENYLSTNFAASYGFDNGGAAGLSGLDVPNSSSSSGTSSAMLHLLSGADRLVFSGPDAGTVDNNIHLEDAKIQFQLTWVPDGGDAVDNPAPKKVFLYYQRTVQAHGKDEGALQIVSDTEIGSLPAHSVVDFTDIHVDPKPLQKKLSVVDGVAIAEFPLSGGLHITASGNPGDWFEYGSDFCEWRVDVALAASQLSRGRSPLSGNNSQGAHDPSFTRWLPLSFSPQVNSQPFRTDSTALSAPWGNLNSFYSMSFQQEPVPPNFDLDGNVVLYIPKGYGGFETQVGEFLPAYAITDATGDRLLFNAGLIGYRDVHSTLSFDSNSGVYTLSNAGPPGALKEAGYYTYRFYNGNLISINDDIGNQQSCAWSTGNDFLTVTDSSSGRSLVFHRPNSTGYASSVDALGPDQSINTRTTLSFDGGGHLTTVQVYDGSGLVMLNQTTFGYGGANGDALTSQTDGASVAAFGYTTDSNMLDPLGLANNRLTSAVYGSSGDTSSSDDGGAIQGAVAYTWGPTAVGYGWGIAAHTNTFTDARGALYTSVFSLTDDEAGAINGFTNTGPDFAGAPANSNVTRLLYSPDIVQPTSVALYDQLYNTGVTQNPWQAFLDTNGNVTGTLDPLYHHWQYGYSADGKLLTSATDPTNLTWQLHYGESGAPASRLTSVSDPNGTTRGTITYNGFGQPLTATTPAAISASGADEQVTFGYHPTTGDLTAVANSLGDQMQITAYDPLGDPLSVSIYPDTGNPATSTAPMTTSILYDAAQHPTQITGPDGNILVTAFTNGVMTQFKTVHAGTTLAQMNLSVDSRGRLYAASDLVGSLAQRRYDKNSNTTRIWDGKGNATSFGYGSNNEPTNVTWPDGHSAGVLYDAAARLRSATDERGVISNYLYYDDDRLKDIQFPAYSDQNVHVTYDAAGRPLVITDSTGSRTYSYDANLKRLQSVTTVLSALPSGHNTFTVSYAYYGDGTLASLTTPVGQTSYNYNAAGALTLLTDPANNVTSWQFDHAGRVTRQQTQPAGGVQIKTDYTYGNALLGIPAVHLNGVVDSVGGQTLWSYALFRTQLGQVFQQQGTGAGANQSETEGFDYDLRGRLTADNDHYQTSSTAVFDSANIYTFDLANNLQGGENGWTYNSSNQATAAGFRSGAPSLTGGTGLSYDASGNLTGMNGSTLGWDCWGHLASVSGSPSVSYTYNSAGQRVSKTVGGVTTFFLYAGNTLVAELDSSGNITQSYSWGPLGLISDSSSSGSRFYLFDGVGNTRFLISSAGVVLSDGAYTAWGASNNASYPSTPFCWKGQGGAYRDSETGLFLMGARYYAPAIGRFLSRDPSGFSSGVNLYGFCGGDPINFFDPDGFAPEDEYWVTRGINFIRPAEAWERRVHRTIEPPGVSVPVESGMTMMVNLHDSWRDWGTVSGDTKAKPWQVWLAGGNACLQTVGAACMFAGPIAEGLGSLGRAESAAGACRGPNCFVAGTKVQAVVRLANGATHVFLKPIEQVKKDDLVLSRNEKTGKTEVKKVLRTFVRQTHLVLTVALADAKTHKVVEQITASREHPFYVTGKGFVPAGGLAVGNAVVTRAGPPLVVASVKWSRKADGYKVYNFQVQDDHSYFVGGTNGGGWVHNAGEDYLNPGDVVFETEEQALTEAARQHGVNAPFEVERVQQFGKNPNLVGPRGEPWERVYVTDGENEAWIDHHSNGHKFEDVSPPRVVPSHYHGPNGHPHIYYNNWVWE